AAQKKLFDDRLILSVRSEWDIEGSDPNGESTPVIGNVAIEYLLTEDGRYRLKGFRKNQYENVIDGQIFVNGIALIFSKEFNKYKELVHKEVKEETQRRSRKRDRNENKKSHTIKRNSLLGSAAHRDGSISLGQCPEIQCGGGRR